MADRVEIILKLADGFFESEECFEKALAFLVQSFGQVENSARVRIDVCLNRTSARNKDRVVDAGEAFQGIEQLVRRSRISLGEKPLDIVRVLSVADVEFRFIKIQRAFIVDSETQLGKRCDRARSEKSPRDYIGEIVLNAEDLGRAKEDAHGVFDFVEE